MNKSFQYHSLLISSFLVMAFIIISCTDQSKDSSDLKFNLDALAGRWESESKTDALHSGRKVSLEIWKKLSLDHYEGSDIIVFNDSDTIVIADLFIEKKDTTWYNTVRVNPNSSSQPVPFKLVSSSEREMIFENTTTESPKHICYQLKEDGSLLVYLESISDGKNKRTEFIYTKKEVGS